MTEVEVLEKLYERIDSFFLTASFCMGIVIVTLFWIAFGRRK